MMPDKSPCCGAEVTKHVEPVSVYGSEEVYYTCNGCNQRLTWQQAWAMCHRPVDAGEEG